MVDGFIVVVMVVVGVSTLVVTSLVVDMVVGVVDPAGVEERSLVGGEIVVDLGDVEDTFEVEVVTIEDVDTLDVDRVDDPGGEVDVDVIDGVVDIVE